MTEWKFIDDEKPNIYKKVCACKGWEGHTELWHLYTKMPPICANCKKEIRKLKGL
jgi:hypothetical protein